MKFALERQEVAGEKNVSGFEENGAHQDEGSKLNGHLRDKAT